MLLLMGWMGMALSAQTLQQAKAYYAKGEYEKAKPVFRRYVKSQPANGSYQLWYGVCCLKTGEPQVAVKHIETAVKKKVTSGQFYLGETYYALYRFEEAVEVLEEYIAELEKRKRSTEEAGKLLEKSKEGLRFLKGVEEVVVIDSMVVDKAGFLSAYRMSHETGSLTTYDDFFKSQEEKKKGIVYAPELGNRIYYSDRQEDGRWGIFSSNNLQGEWSKGLLLPGSFNEEGNANYPYVMADGVTMYYASDGPGSMGGYDIFVTRYNKGSEKFLTPENVGMPFNSPYNDYMYVIDEYNNLGWFASDRYQPEGKVCIYVFIPNSSKQVYDYENTDTGKIIRLGTLHAIRETWQDANAVNEARQRLENAREVTAQEVSSHDFVFVVDDEHTYFHWSDFTSPQAKQAYTDYRQMEKNYKQKQNKLSNMRSTYQRSGKEEKARMAPAMKDLEKHLKQLHQELQQQIIQVRIEEKKHLK